MKLPFHLVDVFAAEPLTGNPLAVVAGGESLPIDLLRRIAREFNQSETTFVMPPTRAEADWRLRSFTAAGAEVFGAGHNALGAWWWLAEAGKLPLAQGARTFHQEIGDRVLPVTVGDHIVMEQEAPEARRQVESVAPGGRVGFGAAGRSGATRALPGGLHRRRAHVGADRRSRGG